MRRYDNLDFQRKNCYSLLERLSENKKRFVTAALKSAERWHDGQLRIYLKRTPYIIHIYGVLGILMGELKVRDEKVLAAAALHDTIEDCGVSRAFLQKRFGRKVADLVASESQNLFRSRNAYMAHFLRTARGTRLIKMADRMDNLRTMLYGTRWTDEKSAQYIMESERYIMPFARRTSRRGAATLAGIASSLKKAKGIGNAYRNITANDRTAYEDTEGTGTWTRRPVID